jgi:hypothetical protein
LILQRRHLIRRALNQDLEARHLGLVAADLGHVALGNVNAELSLGHGELGLGDGELGLGLFVDRRGIICCLGPVELGLCFLELGVLLLEFSTDALQFCLLLFDAQHPASSIHVMCWLYGRVSFSGPLWHAQATEPERELP